MAVGANIKYNTRKQVVQKLLNILTRKPGSLFHRPTKIAYKNGVPATNTAADNPAAKYDLCVDMTNSDVYICIAWTADASATTWLKISD